MKKTIITLLITLCPILAFASDYIYLESTDANNIYVNNDFTVNDGIYRAWVKFTYRNTKAGIAERMHYVKMFRMPYFSCLIILKEFDFAKKKSRDIATYIYRKDGKLIDEETDENSEFKYIVPSSIEEDILNFLHYQINNITPDNDDDNSKVIEQMPSFPGGQEALMTYINKELKYPVEVQENGIHGTVTITFIVEKDGSITNARVTKSVDPALDNEALRVINSMPKWIPGKKDGQNIKVKYRVPVLFELK